MPATKFDPEDRLRNFAERIVRVSEAMKKTRAGLHFSDQLLRAGTSPRGQHGEAEGAESGEDFVHKMRIRRKELREARGWPLLIQRAGLVAKPELFEPLIAEADELVWIFSASLRTARRAAT